MSYQWRNSVLEEYSRSDDYRDSDWFSYSGNLFNHFSSLIVPMCKKSRHKKWSKTETINFFNFSLLDMYMLQFGSQSQNSTKHKIDAKLLKYFILNEKIQIYNNCPLRNCWSFYFDSNSPFDSSCS